MQPTSRSLYFGMGVVLTVALAAAILLAPMASETVPRTGVGFTATPDLIFCSTSPAWAKPGTPETTEVLDFLARHGLVFRQVYEADCHVACSTSTGSASGTTVACHPRAVLVDVAPQGIRESWGGACFTDDREPWATVVLRERPEVDRGLLFAHELAHCRGFLGHVRGPSFYGLALAPRPGHLLHPDLSKAGWKLTALPE